MEEYYYVYLEHYDWEIISLAITTKTPRTKWAKKWKRSIEDCDTELDISGPYSLDDINDHYPNYPLEVVIDFATGLTDEIN